MLPQALATSAKALKEEQSKFEVREPSRAVRRTELSRERPWCQGGLPLRDATGLPRGFSRRK